MSRRPIQNPADPQDSSAVRELANQDEIEAMKNQDVPNNLTPEELARFERIETTDGQFKGWRYRTQIQQVEPEPAWWEGVVAMTLIVGCLVVGALAYFGVLTA